MLALLEDPATTYRRVELDARIEGSDGAGLTRLCLERAIADIGTACRTSDRPVRADALARAGAALLALLEGVAPDNPLRGPLLSFYGSARARVLAGIGSADPDDLAQVRQDLRDVLALL